MIVVSDTSPITALVTIGREELLRELFHEVVIPLAVKVELLRSHTKLPDWIRCVSVKNMDHASQLAVRLDLWSAAATGALATTTPLWGRASWVNRLQIFPTERRAKAVSALVPHFPTALHKAFRLRCFGQIGL